MKTKREEIKELILKIQAQQELVKKELDQANAAPGFPEEPEIEETSGSTGMSPELAIGPWGDPHPPPPHRMREALIVRCWFPFHRVWDGPQLPPLTTDIKHTFKFVLNKHEL